MYSAPSVVPELSGLASVKNVLVGVSHGGTKNGHRNQRTDKEKERAHGDDEHAA